jgi:hypothetical protein
MIRHWRHVLLRLLENHVLGRTKRSLSLFQPDAEVKANLRTDARAGSSAVG